MEQLSLRDYQRRAIDDLYEWFRNNKEGHPVLNMPGGSGKSVVIGTLVKEAVTSWPQTRVLMLVGVKELIQQNAAKLVNLWPNAPMGIYSASVGKRDMGNPITYAGIGSVCNRANQIGHIDLCVIDECFVSGTKISTPSGDVDIDLLRTGDLVYNQCGVGTVEKTMCQQSNDIYKVELSNGNIITCTGNHPFFTDKGWERARELAKGSSLFSIKDMSGLWERVHALDKNKRGRKPKKPRVREVLEQEKILLSSVCEEIQPDSFGCSSQKENKGNAQEEEITTYKTWRKRAIAAFASTSAASRTRLRLGSGISDKDIRGSQKRGISELLQGGHRQPTKNDSNRIRRFYSCNDTKEKGGQEKIREIGSIRVESISRVKQTSPRVVFNIRVSGHPSYFANGVAVHNCHGINNKKNGMYRKLIDDLLAINPNMRLIGFTASPYRLGQGDLTEGDDALFTDILTPVTIEELVYKGYLCPLRSKVTDTKLSTEGIKKRGGEYVAKDMQRAFNVDEKNVAIASEIAERASDRRHWLIFCAGIEHAEAMAEALQHIGIKADHLNGGHGKRVREEKLRQFESGEVQALCVVGMLTTGYDFEDLDCVVFLRATESPGLYLQSAVRAMRIKSHSDDALVLDFVGNVERHGPITCVQPPPKKGEEGGVAPTKDCPECGEIVHASLMQCPACGHEFPLRIEKDPPRLRNDDIMGLSGREMGIQSWHWSKHVSQRSGMEMIKVRYYGLLSDPVISEYITLLHDGYAGRKALKTITTITDHCGVSMAQFGPDSTLDDLADALNDAPPPASIEYRRDGQFHRVLNRKWQQEELLNHG